MVRTKTGILLIFLSGLMFAEEVQSDSLKIFDPLKRQKLFRVLEDDFQFPPNEECVGLGCCLIPVSGCLLVGHDIIAKDTTKKNSLQIYKNKWGFGIGYSGGVCYTGEDLVASASDWDVNPLRWFYWLNTAEASISYFLGEKWGIEIGGGYGWANIQQSKYDNWEFRFLPIFLGCKLRKVNFRSGYIFITVDDHGETPGSVAKDGIGKGYNFVFEYKVNKFIELFLRLGGGDFTAKEHFPDDTIESKWNIGFNGIGILIGYEFQ